MDQRLRLTSGREHWQIRSTVKLSRSAVAGLVTAGLVATSTVATAAPAVAADGRADMQDDLSFACQATD
jgi:hypothetical protein